MSHLFIGVLAILLVSYLQTLSDWIMQITSCHIGLTGPRRSLHGALLSILSIKYAAGRQSGGSEKSLFYYSLTSDFLFALILKDKWLHGFSSWMNFSTGVTLRGCDYHWGCD